MRTAVVVALALGAAAGMAWDKLPPKTRTLDSYSMAARDTIKNDKIPQRCPEGTFYNSTLPWGIGGLAQCEIIPALKNVICIRGGAPPGDYVLWPKGKTELNFGCPAGWGCLW